MSVELVHLLADDVRVLADPLEHLDVLEHRGDDEPVAEAGGPVGEAPDEARPDARDRRQDVVHPLRGAKGNGWHAGHPVDATGRPPPGPGPQSPAGTVISRQTATPQAEATGSRNFGGDRYLSRWSYE